MNSRNVESMSNCPFSLNLGKRKCSCSHACVKNSLTESISEGRREEVAHSSKMKKKQGESVLFCLESTVGNNGDVKVRFTWTGTVDLRELITVFPFKSGG